MHIPRPVLRSGLLTHRAAVGGIIATAMFAGALLVGLSPVLAAPIPPVTVPGPACTTNAAALTPVVCLPAGSGEDSSAPLGTGDTITFAAQIVNNGPDVADSTVVLTLPPGLRAADPPQREEQWWLDDGSGTATSLFCSNTNGGITITCPIGDLPRGADILLLIDLTAQSDAVVGTSATFTVALGPDTGQPAFPPTQVQGTVDFTGVAHLHTTVTPATATMTVGKGSSVTVTVHNAGPQAAPNAAVVGFAEPEDGDRQHFVITNSAPLEGGRAATLAVTIHASPADDSNFGFWPVGTIAPGADAAVVVTVRAVSAGHDTLVVTAGSDNGDPPCATDGAGCESDASAELTATAPVVTATHSATPTPTPKPTPTHTTLPQTLANTGFHGRPWVLLAVAEVLAGAALMVAGRRRRPCGYR